MNHFLPAHSELFFTKNDSLDMRLGDLVHSDADGADEAFLIAGYPDDEGVKHNGGRTGAAQGPDSIRDRFYRMTPSPEY